MNATKRWKNDDSTIPQLPELVLDQQGLSTDPSRGDRRTKMWFVHESFYAGVLVYDGGTSYISHQGQHPVATVTIVLPTVMVGSEQEIYNDVRAAVERHAAKHLS
jgi:hypothetical protein